MGVKKNKTKIVFYSKTIYTHLGKSEVILFSRALQINNNGDYDNDLLWKTKKQYVLHTN